MPDKSIYNTENSIIEHVAHDLKGIINQINRLNEILNEKLRAHADNEIYKILTYIDILCKQGKQINNNLLDFCELEMLRNNLKPTINSVNSLVKQQSEIYKLQADKKHINFKAIIPEKEYYCEFDPLSLARVLNNLFSNALKFTNPFGQITIAISSKEEKIIISVNDTGIGISKEFWQEIFKKYSKAKRYGTQNEKCTGLGLYIAKEIINQYDGRIWFESKEKEGTTFYIEMKCIDSN